SARDVEVAAPRPVAAPQRQHRVALHHQHARARARVVEHQVAAARADDARRIGREVAPHRPSAARTRERRHGPRRPDSSTLVSAPAPRERRHRPMADTTSYPYDTHLDVRFGPLELVDIPGLVAACTHPWYNQTLCRVNDSVVRLGVVQGEYHWH